MSSNKQMYYCFGCHASGNVYTFLMKYENDTFPRQSKSWQIVCGSEAAGSGRHRNRKKRAGKRMRLLEVNKEAARYFYYMLRSPHGEVGMRYLTERKADRRDYASFRTGLRRENGEQVVHICVKKAFLPMKNQRFRTYDVLGTERDSEVSFGTGVMFTIQDINHRLIGFEAGSWETANRSTCNSQETMIFDKRRNIYWTGFARSARTGNHYPVRGYMDVIATYQAGFTQAVASLGTAFTVEQANLLHRYAENITLYT